MACLLLWSVGPWITSGKKVYEMRPAVTWDKGRAIKLLMKRWGKGNRRSGLIPLYFSDDLTDEDGFKVIENYGHSILVFVGEPNRYSVARYFLRSLAELAVFGQYCWERHKTVSNECNP